MMNMNGKAVIFLFMLFFFSLSSLPPSTIAVPSSRSMRSISNGVKLSRKHVYDELQKKERMDVEIADYTGTGANNHHDPRSPPGTF